MLVSALLKDLQTLIRHDVFASSGEARRKKIDEILGKTYPDSFRAYFSTVEGEDLRKDSIRLIKFVSTGRFSTTDFSLFKALQGFVVRELSIASSADKNEVSLLEVIKALRNHGEQDLEKEILRFTERFPGVSRIRVQTALPLSTEEKNRIRDHFNKEGALYYITFTVDSSLLGGMRIFKDGALFDVSWARQIGSYATLP